MAPRPRHPRLASIDVEACIGALAHGASIRALAVFARGELDYDPEDMVARVLSVSAALRASALRPIEAWQVEDLVQALHLSRPLDVILLAAYARAKLELGGDVPPKALAALAGLSAHHVRLAIRKRALTAERLETGDWKISAKAAKAFLERNGT